MRGPEFWQFVHVRSGARIGERCVLGTSLFVDSDAACHMQNSNTIRRQATAEYQGTRLRRLKEASVVEIPYLEHRGEPLWLELQDFVEAAGSGRQPLVDGQAGVAALALCQRILEAAKQD